MSGEYLAFVNADDLERLQQQVRGAMSDSGANSIFLLDISGVVLACAGEPPLHPTQMGAMAAGIYAAMRQITSTTGTQTFSVCMPADSLFLEFLRVNQRLFLLGISSEADTAIETLRNLAPFAETALTSALERAEKAATNPDEADTAPASLQQIATQLTSADFIESKLNELFRQS
ncbi:MAG: hypothetical protein N2111_12230 [Candidatus Sumerlaeaceae bacterium]|nr:hypothetical protein [Candidatus Sumerlaeaceae bacterium]